jgi:hypothetical protein
MEYALNTQVRSVGWPRSAWMEFLATTTMLVSSETRKVATAVRPSTL